MLLLFALEFGAEEEEALNGGILGKKGFGDSLLLPLVVEGMPP